jgi:peptidoglycan/xylan/chitin deacetylase (PgdA/CDA1 family)
LNIAIQASIEDNLIIRELLSPWNIFFTELDKADATIAYKQKPSTIQPTVIIPSQTTSFANWGKENGLGFTQETGLPTPVNATSKTTLTIKPKMQYIFEKKKNVSFKDENQTNIQIEDEELILKLDLIQEYNFFIDGILHPEQSTLHRVLTGLPIPYGLAPKRLRDFLMKADKELENLSLCDKLPIDAMRFMLINAIEKICKTKIEKKTFSGNNHVCILTHDVETANGLQKALVLKKIEEKYDLKSTWYIPSDRYRLNNEAIRELANHGEVGSHDTKHDGKLVHLKKEELPQRLIDSKQTLTTITQKPVVGFRAPILQHNQVIIQALNEAGYLYDTSVPTWEPKHPYTMKPHGIGTVYPITLNGLIEIPLTIPQDHQLLHVLGLTPREVFKTWEPMADLIQDLNGVCIYLVHPDYELADNGTDLYEQFVSELSSDNQATLTVPSQYINSTGQKNSNNS